MPVMTGIIAGRWLTPASSPAPGSKSFERRLESRPCVAPPVAAHELAEDRRRPHPADDVHAQVAVQRRRHVVVSHGGGDADRGGLVAPPGVVAAGQLAGLEEQVPTLLDQARRPACCGTSRAAGRGRGRARALRRRTISGSAWRTVDIAAGYRPGPTVGRPIGGSPAWPAGGRAGRPTRRRPGHPGGGAGERLRPQLVAGSRPARAAAWPDPRP